MNIAPAFAERVPDGYVVDPRFPYTVELAPMLAVPLAGTFLSPTGAEILLPGFLGVRLAGFVPVAERFQAGGGLQALWGERDGRVYDVTTLLGGARWLLLEDRWRTMADLQLAVDVGSGFGLGVRAAASVAYELPVKGLFAQGTLAGEVLGVRLRAAVTLSGGLSYAW